MQQLIYKSLFVLEIAVFLATIIISWIYRRNRELNPIRFYLAQGAILIVAMIFIQNTSGSNRIHEILFNLFSFLDVTVLYFYFWCLMQGKSIRVFLFCSFLSISAICIYFWTSRQFGWSTFIPILYGIQNLFITLPCLLYIFELFKSDEEVDLKTKPHFYIACAFLFFYGATFPFYITYETLYEVTSEIRLVLNSVHEFLSIIMYFTIMKAFLCPYPDHKLL